MTWLTSDLLADIRREARLSTSETEYTDAVLLAMADDELRATLLPPILAAREEYLVTSYDYSITASTQSYRIPTRALYGIVRDVTVIDANGNGRSLNLLDNERIDDFAGTTGSPNDLEGFAISGDMIVLCPTPSTTSGTLRVRYYRRPSALTAASTSSDTSPHAITAGASGTTITIGTHSFTTSSVIDFVQANPGFDALSIDVAITGAAATTITIATAITGLATGDFVCLANQSPVPQIPAEMHTVLATAVATRVLRQLGNPRYAEIKQDLDSSLVQVRGAMTPRVQGQAYKLLNRYSPLASARRSRRQWWGS